MSDIKKIKVMVNDDAFEDILKIAIEKAPRHGDCMIDQIEFEWTKDVFGKPDATLVVTNRRLALETVRQNWTHNRSKNSRIRPGRLGYEIVRKSNDPVELAIRCTGSCTATLEMIARWVEKWERLIEEGTSDKAALREYISTQLQLANRIQFLINKASGIMLTGGLVNPKTGDAYHNGTTHEMNKMFDDFPGFSYAWGEERARKKAEWESRKEDIKKLDEAFKDEQHGEQVFATCPTGEYAVKRFNRERQPWWLRKVAKAYADALGDTSGVEVFAGIDETVRLKEEARKAKAKATRERNNAKKSLEKAKPK